MRSSARTGCGSPHRRKTVGRLASRGRARDPSGAFHDPFETEGGTAMSDGTRTLEQEVMRTARSYLFGHPDAWQIPGGDRRAPRRAERALRLDPFRLVRALRMTEEVRPRGAHDLLLERSEEHTSE